MAGGSNQSPQRLEDYVYQWLDKCLDFGISEEQFWNMTLAELERVINSKRRAEKLRLQERASFDYRLADLIGRSIARIQSSSNHMPELSDFYPELFNDEEIKEKKAEKQDELSALRFKLFVDAHNKKFNKEATNN